MTSRVLNNTRIEQDALATKGSFLSPTTITRVVHYPIAILRSSLPFENVAGWELSNPVC